MRAFSEGGAGFRGGISGEDGTIEPGMETLGASVVGEVCESHGLSDADEA